MGKIFKHSPRTMTLATVLGVALVATSAMAQPPENHGQSPHGSGAPRGNGGAPAAPGGNQGGGNPGGFHPGGGGPQQAHPQPAPAQQASPRPQQGFNGGAGNWQRPGQPDGRPGGGQFGGQRGPDGPHGNGGQFDGRPGGQPGNQFGGQRGPGGNGGGYGQHGPNWGAGAQGQRHDNPGPQRGAFDDRRGPDRWQGGGNYRAWNNQWRGDNRYDWRGWRDSHRDTFRMGRYDAPYRGYSYRRLSAGFVLDPLFYGNNYAIYNPGSYRLPEAYVPYRWIRYYNDAILVDTYTGQVVDTLYGFFW